jgi:copper resistance protein B
MRARACTRLAIAFGIALAACDSACAQQETQAPADHVAPPPPQHPMAPMDHDGMMEAMDMDDSATHAMFRLDRFEYADSDEGAAMAWSAQAWIGQDFDKLRLRSEGERTGGDTGSADVEILWDHAAGAYWDTQLGARHDFGFGPDRDWAAFGILWLAPYWFEISATAYAGASDRTTLRMEVDYELSLTQRLVLQPRIELNAYGKDDAATRVGSGLADAEFGVRLRYEIRREFAPYVGVEWSRRFGQTADLARAEGIGGDDTRLVAGVRIWY